MSCLVLCPHLTKRVFFAGAVPSVQRGSAAHAGQSTAGLQASDHRLLEEGPGSAADLCGHPLPPRRAAGRSRRNANTRACRRDLPAAAAAAFNERKPAEADWPLQMKSIVSSQAGSSPGLLCTRQKARCVGREICCRRWQQQPRSMAVHPSFCAPESPLLPKKLKR